MSVRRPAVAGTWYPSSPARLVGAVREHLERAADDAEGEDGADLDDTGELVALIAPHAGLVYSGPVAAHAYRLLPRQVYDTIAIVGPSHYVAFEGASVWPRGAFDTPLGPIAVDEAAASELIAECEIARDFPAAHAREHSLEMQLPFLAECAPAVPILPIVMGRQTRGTAFALGDALARVLERRRALLIASSDLSHFNPSPVAASLDADVLRLVEAFDPDALMALLETRPDHACGGGPIVSVLHAARQLGATASRVLRYGDSGDVSGDRASVVGYMAAAEWR